MPSSPAKLRPVALALLAALLAPGCMGPTYYLSGVAGATTLEGTWDFERAEAALRAAGLAADRTDGTRVVALDPANATTLVLSPAPEGGVAFHVTVETDEKVGTQAKAERRGDEVIGHHRPRVEAILATVEAEAGWTRRADLQWSKGILHAD